MKRILIAIFFSTIFLTFAQDNPFLATWKATGQDVNAIVMFKNNFCYIDKKSDKSYYNYRITGNTIQIDDFVYYFHIKNSTEIWLIPAFDSGEVVVLLKE